MKNTILFPTYYKVAEVSLQYKSTVLPRERVQITNSRKTFDTFYDFCYDSNTIDHRESFYAMYLNRSNHVVGVCLISQGGIAGTVVDIRLVLQAALLLNASGIILSHNHPSGRCQPSNEDITITKNMKDACKILEMQLLDHIIVTSTDDYYSFADEGII